MASLMVGARRSDGACGTDPRRVEGLEDIGGTLRFSRTATTTHSLGRPLLFEPGTFAAAPSEGLLWYGDDYSRLVVLASALPLAGGRATAGAWAEYAWGAQELEPGVPLVGLVVPTLPFPVSTVRSVDIGACSQHQVWTDPATGCGLADQVLRTVEGFGLTIPAPLPPVIIPGIETCVAVAEVGGRPGGTWAVEIGTPSISPVGSSDRLCVDLPVRASTSLDCAALLGIPVLLGCAYGEASVQACGAFGMRSTGDGHFDPTFTLSSFRFDPGPGAPNGPRICEFPARIDEYRRVITDALRGVLPSAVAGAIQGALVQRETSFPTAAPSGTCTAPPGTLAFRSECAQPATGLTPDQACALFVTGDPMSTAVRATCEARGSGISCTQQSDCGGTVMATRRRCETDRRCGGSPFGSSCQSDSDCVDPQLPPGDPGLSCLVWRGECVDSEPVCYWNVEADRIETLPSALEIVLADETTDETYVAFSTIGVLPLLEASAVCRRAVPPECGPEGECAPGLACIDEVCVPPFAAVAASGTLGPSLGAPFP
jgi:hypothetical protein